MQADFVGHEKQQEVETRLEQISRDGASEVQSVGVVGAEGRACERFSFFINQSLIERPHSVKVHVVLDLKFHPLRGERGFPLRLFLGEQQGAVG